MSDAAGGRHDAPAEFRFATGALGARDRRVSDDPAEEPVRIPVTGELDLHTFKPADVASLLDEYFSECLRHGIGSVRVIHGKGTGTLRTTVQHHLRRSPLVRSFRTAEPADGGWGATWVTLR